MLKTRAQRVTTMTDGLNQVWQIIGNDILLGEDDENPTLNGKDVGSIVADHADTYLEGELLKQWKSASYEQRHVWLDEAFPAKSLYGF